MSTNQSRTIDEIDTGEFTSKFSFLVKSKEEVAVSEINTYMSKGSEDEGGLLEAIYSGTKFTKFVADGGFLKVQGSLMILRIQGAVPGAPVYHETLNTLTRMIYYIIKAFKTSFFVPQYDMATSKERYMGGDQLFQGGQLNDDKVYISTGDTDFGAMSESQSVTKY